MPDSVNFEFYRLGNVMAYKLKKRVTNPLSNITFSTCKVIVKTNNFLACFHQTIDKMRANETCATCDEISHRS